MLSLWLLEQQSPVLLNEWTLLKSHFLNLEALLKLWSTFSFWFGLTLKCVLMFRHVCSFQTQQLGAPRKYPRPETAGCIQQEVSVYVKMYRTLKFAVLRDVL